MDKFIEPIRLKKKHLQNCKVLPDRYAILDYMPKKAVVAEVGVLAGDFSKHILSVTSPSRFHLIDTFNISDWNDSANKRFHAHDHLAFVNNRFKSEIDKGQVVINQGLSWERLSEFDDQYFDWLYIDGDHRYSGVKNDLDQAIRVLKPGGHIVMNDYIFYSHMENMAYGVIHAVNEICETKDFEMIFFALHPQMYCDVVIKKL